MRKIFLLISVLVLTLTVSGQTDFSSPYNCSADDGVISGDAPSNKVYLNETADPHQIEWSDVSQDYTAVISWTVSVANPCYISVSLDLGTAVSSNKHIFEVKVLDDGSNELGAVEEGPAYTGDGFTESEQVKALSGKILLPAAGNYTIELRNNRNYCKGSIKNVILSYADVAPVTDFSTPYACAADDAVLSGEISNSFKLYDETAPHYIMWSDRGLANPAAASWNIIATRACYISVSLDLGPVISSNKHIFEVYVKDADGNEIGMVTETGENTDAEQVKALNGKILIPEAGNYTIELKNNRDFGKGAIKNIILSYAGAAPITDFSTPYSCAADDAVLSGTISSSFGLETATDPHYIFWNDRALSSPAAVSWNIIATRTCHISASLDLGPVVGSNKHIFEVYLKDADGNELGMLTEGSESTESEQVKVLSGTLTIPAAGNYTIELKNNRDYGKGAIKNVILSYAGGGVIDIPGTIALNEAILSTRAFIDGDGLHFTDADHLGTISGEYAKWNIHVAADGMYKFTANCNASNYSHMKISVLDSEENVLYTHKTQWSFNTETAVVTPEWFLETGNYTLKAENPADHSNGYITSLSAAAVEGILIVDELATDMAYINEKNGESMKPLLKRTFKGGMYNTVCFPFNNVTDEELTTIFGAGYELLEMTSATLDGNTLNLNFASVDLSQHTYGRPYLIKPTQDVVNPLFNSHTIYKSTSHLTVTGTAADFIGSFIKSEVPAGEDNLFLGPNDLLYFSSSATPIKGMRAWFKVKVPNPQHVIQHARIVKGEQVITSINLIDGNMANETVKTIENGQLVIIRDGVRYNAMGIRLQ